VAECLRSLPAVSNTARRPWILPTGAGADAIATVIAKCPSGALHFTRRDGGAAETPPEHNAIVPMPGAALYIRGRVQLRSADGSLIVEEIRLALCRCGQSRNKPFCDNSHRGARFDDPGAVADGGAPVETNNGLTITASANGPLLAQGAFILRAADGQGQYQGANAELCRCGASGAKPFCDGTHELIGFRSEETGDD
jgi:CDGSH-type Zn-finger protein